LSDILRARAHESARDEAIRSFLRNGPEFLRDDAELLGELGLRLDAANLIDFGPAALARVTQAHREETNVRQHLEAVARANFLAQAQTHAAVIELLEASDHADLAARVDQLARARFGLAAGVIALEGTPMPAGWRPLVEGQIDLVLGHGRTARLGVLPTALGLFDARAADIGSLALVRLSLGSGTRTGILAFGAADETAFSPTMGHELIDFLARVTERTADRWPLA
jgi:uncharacterized protein YigA (DUF484 family)